MQQSCFMNTENALIIFVRKPELGKVKTRLAAQIGNERALGIYTRLLEHTISIASTSDIDTFIFMTEQGEDYKYSNFFTEIQTGANLGERMCNASQNVFKKGYRKVVIIGSDCPGLESSHIEEAFQQLNNYDITIGPAYDGGYYLLGMKKLHTLLFENKNWSTASVLADTIDNITTLSLSSYKLETLRDVDQEQDLPEGWK